MAEYSPDLDPLDFYIWSALQEKVQVTPHANLVALHQSVTKGWDHQLPTYICQTYYFFRSCLEAVMAKNASILNR
jgi:hypothetical protein